MLQDGHYDRLEIFQFERNKLRENTVKFQKVCVRNFDPVMVVMKVFDTAEDSRAIENVRIATKGHTVKL